MDTINFSGTDLKDSLFCLDCSGGCVAGVGTAVVALAATGLSCWLCPHEACCCIMGDGTLIYEILSAFSIYKNVFIILI